MGTGLRLNMKMVLFVLCILLFLLFTAVIILHAATPNIFHTVALTPKFFNRH
jgi:hypothetical protein